MLMKTFTIHTKRLWASSLPIVMLGVACSAPMALAIPTAPAQESAPAEALALPEKSPEALFEYKIESRPDPFQPFISEKATSANINEIIPINEQLSGMQLFEPGQLNLVAIVMADNNDFAMAEDTTGKGYILNIGMKIGRRGLITSIQSNKVTIEETAFTRAGKKLTSKIVMLLKKEGEE